MDFSFVCTLSTAQGAPERHHELLEQVQLCERLGYDCVWFTEHHFEEYGRPCPDLLLAHAAALTSEIDLGIGVFVLPWHHPVDIAERIATLDHLCNGRLRVGIGRGNQPHEFAGFNIALDEARARFAESYEIITGLLANDTFGYEGKFWQVPEVRLVPKPIQKPYPSLWQPAVSHASIEAIVERGMHGLIAPYLTPYPVLKEKYFDVWNNLKAQAGRNELRMAHNEFVYVAETDEQAFEEAKQAAIWYPRKAAKVWGEQDPSRVPSDFAYLGPILEMLAELSYEEIYESRSLIGGPERVIQKLRYLDEECGVDELICFTWMGPQLTNDQMKRSFELLARDVMPEFKQQPVSAGVGE